METNKLKKTIITIIAMMTILAITSNTSATIGTSQWGGSILNNSPMVYYDFATDCSDVIGSKDCDLLDGASVVDGKLFLNRTASVWQRARLDNKNLDLGEDFCIAFDVDNYDYSSGRFLQFSDSNQLNIYPNAGVMRFYYRNTTGTTITIDGTESLPGYTDKWSYIISFNASAGTIKSWVNGTQDFDRTDYQGNFDLTNIQVSIPHSQNVGIGYLDNVAIFDTTCDQTFVDSWMGIEEEGGGNESGSNNLIDFCDDVGTTQPGNLDHVYFCNKTSITGGTINIHSFSELGTEGSDTGSMAALGNQKNADFTYFGSPFYVDYNGAVSVGLGRLVHSESQTGGLFNTIGKFGSSNPHVQSYPFGIKWHKFDSGGKTRSEGDCHFINEYTVLCDFAVQNTDSVTSTKQWEIEAVTKTGNSVLSRTDIDGSYKGFEYYINASCSTWCSNSFTYQFVMAMNDSSVALHKVSETKSYFNITLGAGETKYFKYVFTAKFLEDYIDSYFINSSNHIIATNNHLTNWVNSFDYPTTYCNANATWCEAYYRNIAGMWQLWQTPLNSAWQSTSTNFNNSGFWSPTKQKYHGVWTSDTSRMIEDLLVATQDQEILDMMKSQVDLFSNDLYQGHYRDDIRDSYKGTGVQSPLLQCSIWQLYQADQNLTWLNSVYSAAKSDTEWRYNNRRDTNDLYYCGGLECGDGRGSDIVAPDVNAEMYYLYHCMESMAVALNITEDIVLWQGNQTFLNDKIQHFYKNCDGEGFIFSDLTKDTLACKGTRKDGTAFAFKLLYTNHTNIDSAMVQSHIEALNDNDRYGGLVGLPDISKADPSYGTGGGLWWKGNRWSILSQFAAHGLYMFDEQEEAEKQRNNTIALVSQTSTGTEWYNPTGTTHTGNGNIDMYGWTMSNIIRLMNSGEYNITFNTTEVEFPELPDPTPPVDDWYEVFENVHFNRNGGMGFLNWDIPSAFYKSQSTLLESYYTMYENTNNSTYLVWADLQLQNITDRFSTWGMSSGDFRLGHILGSYAAFAYHAQSSDNATIVSKGTYYRDFAIDNILPIIEPTYIEFNYNNELVAVLTETDMAGTRAKPINQMYGYVIGMMYLYNTTGNNTYDYRAYRLSRGIINTFATISCQGQPSLLCHSNAYRYDFGQEWENYDGIDWGFPPYVESANYIAQELELWYRLWKHGYLTDAQYATIQNSIYYNMIIKNDINNVLMSRDYTYPVNSFSNWNAIWAAHHYHDLGYYKGDYANFTDYHESILIYLYNFINPTRGADSFTYWIKPYLSLVDPRTSVQSTYDTGQYAIIKNDEFAKNIATYLHTPVKGWQTSGEIISIFNISDVQVVSIGSSTARVLFTTNTLANSSVVVYNGNETHQYDNALYYTSHNVLASGLTSNTTYNVNITACDNYTCDTTSGTQFTTLAPGVTVERSLTSTVTGFILLLFILGVILAISVFTNERELTHPTNITLAILSLVTLIISIVILAGTIGG